MSRIILMAMVLAVTVAGCNRFPDNGLQIVANLLPDDNCFVTGDQEERVLGGIWDVGYAPPGGGTAGYTIALALESYLVLNSLEFQGEQNNLQVDNYDITILHPDGTKMDLGALANPYRVRTSAVIPPIEPGGDPSREVGAGTGIPGSYQPAILSALATLPPAQRSVLLDIRAGGTTAGGFSQRSGPFLWPVSLCTGCLRDCLAEPDEVNICLAGQDIWRYCEVLPAEPEETAP